MKITNLKTNHITNPIGYDISSPTLSFVIAESTGKKLQAARIRISRHPDMTDCIYDSGMSEEISALGHTPKERPLTGSSEDDSCHLSELLEGSGHYLTETLEGGCRYYWNVEAVADNGDCGISETAWFEGGRKEKEWNLPWITAPFDKEEHPVLGTTFLVDGAENLVSARLYIAGLGLYEAWLNGEKAGDEYLTPYFNDYRFWVQYGTYDITDQIRDGENEIAVMLGNGWYKGRFGYMGDGTEKELYGDQFRLSAELVMTFADGHEERVVTDENWKCRKSPVRFSNIYDGEIYDASVSIWEKKAQERGTDGTETEAAETQSADQQPTGRKLNGADVPALLTDAPEGRVCERLSLPVKIHERLAPVKLIITPRGEQLIDFGQEITGWVEFDYSGQELLEDAAPDGLAQVILEDTGSDTSVQSGMKSDSVQKRKYIRLQGSEILQEDCFYRDNLRTALAEFIYLPEKAESAKTESVKAKSVHVRPHFTFYGFRYVKVTGIKLTEENLSDYNFRACAIYSDLRRTGYITTSDAKLNRLIENTVWGQKGNFLDVPTDCPQRDERCGWTGDAQVFCAAATYHMDTAAFYRKYLTDMRYEQEKNAGSVPYVVPDILSIFQEHHNLPPFDLTENKWGDNGSCAWGDAATIIPWTMYQFYGDKKLLEEAWPNMKGWTDFIIHMDENHCGGGRLWNVGFHFADWLALDNPDKGSCFGKTDPYFVASVYYMYSAQLTARAAAVLGKDEDAAYYARIAAQVRQAIRDEYITRTGRVATDTQTAQVLALFFDLVDEEHREKVAAELKRKLLERSMHLDTGFVGTGYLCKALTKAGMSEDAWTLLFQEDYPSWLYEVNMGATTVWERWNSVLPDGSISDTGMNSLNHYAYGAVAEWIYRTAVGLAPDEAAPGFGKAVFAPIPNERLQFANASYDSASGTWEFGWKYTEDGGLEFAAKVPFGCEGRFVLPQGFELTGISRSTEYAEEEQTMAALAAGAEAILDTGRWKLTASRISSLK